MTISESAREIEPGHIRSTALEYTYSEDNTPRKDSAVTAADVDRVYAAVCERHDGRVSYVSSKQVDIDGLSATKTGTALSELALADDCPLDIERWTTSAPYRYRVTEGETA